MDMSPNDKNMELSAEHGIDYPRWVTDEWTAAEYRVWNRVPIEILCAAPDDMRRDDAVDAEG